jgi:response regulator RpfG family c-di-GMP phosphodiesterase
MSKLYDFIIIDDDSTSNTICRKIIEKAYPSVNIHDFTDPVEGFNEISKKYSTEEIVHSGILLLDIKMPVMDAWDFLEQFEAQNHHVKERVKICILSSSVDKNDMIRANANKNVEYYLIKPLTIESIGLLMSVLNRKYIHE